MVQVGQEARLRKLISLITHETVLSQVLGGTFAIVQLMLLTRLLDVSDYAHYVVAASIWAIANAAVGVGIGLRISNDAANGIAEISFTRREQARMVLAAIVCGGCFAFFGASMVQSFLVGATLLSYVFCEAAISFVVGSRAFRSFLAIFATRAGIPVILLLAGSLFFDLTFDAAVVAVFAGNILGALIVGKRFALSVPKHCALSSGKTGAISLGLWILASADKIILERLVEPEELAGYAMAYGLLDRVFRAIQNVYTSRYIADAFSGGLRHSPVWLYLGVGVLGLVVAPIATVACHLISGGRYSPHLVVAIVVSLGLCAMAVSVPLYLQMVSSQRYLGPLVAIYIIAAVNIISNLLLVPRFGVFSAAFLTFAAYVAWWGYLAVRNRRVEFTRSVDS